jgi:translation elongation factor P/translation initiation factor 5A
MSSASEEELETGTVKVNEWQQVKNNKRQKINTSQAYILNTDITISNRFNSMIQDESVSQTNLENKTP